MIVTFCLVLNCRKTDHEYSRPGEAVELVDDGREDDYMNGDVNRSKSHLNFKR